MVEMATPPHLSYFNVRGRAQMVGVMAAFVGQRIDYDWNPNWPAIRPQTPLGQLPVLRDGAVVLSQSMAIVRYLARKWNLQGSCTEDFALSEMLLEQASSLLDKLLVLSVPDDAKWHVFEQKDVPDHLEPLEQKLKASASAPILPLPSFSKSLFATPYKDPCLEEGSRLVIGTSVGTRHLCVCSVSTLDWNLKTSRTESRAGLGNGTLAPGYTRNKTSSRTTALSPYRTFQMARRWLRTHSRAFGTWDTNVACCPRTATVKHNGCGLAKNCNGTAPGPFTHHDKSLTRACFLRKRCRRGWKSWQRG
eukprot:m.253588 g.253588  ORF g.253588 m.253588 type:complete len:306 (-) comp19136_c0_seq4:937-1854(-)